MSLECQAKKSGLTSPDGEDQGRGWDWKVMGHPLGHLLGHNSETRPLTQGGTRADMHIVGTSVLFELGSPVPSTAPYTEGRGVQMGSQVDVWKGEWEGGWVDGWKGGWMRRMARWMDGRMGR